MSAAKLFAVFLGLTVGNFIYQAMTGEQWSVATERTVFQGGALAAVWLVNWREALA